MPANLASLHPRCTALGLTGLLLVAVAAACSSPAVSPGPEDGTLDMMGSRDMAIGEADLTDHPDFSGEDGPGDDLSHPDLLPHRRQLAFGNAKITNTNHAVGPLAVADFDGDGKLDVAVAAVGDPSIAILLGRGDGTFTINKEYPINPGALAVAVADADKDGHADIAVACNGARLNVLYGAGDGSFSVTGIGGPAGVVGMAFRDLNEDGLADLALVDSARIQLLLAAPGRSFGVPLAVPAGGVPTTLVIGDFNGDKKTDLATGEKSGGYVNVMLATGKGAFAGPVSYLASSTVKLLATGDLNNDTRTDLIAVNWNDNDISVLMASPGGGFDTPKHAMAGPFIRVAVADFDLDGAPDVAAYPGNPLTLFLGDGRGGLLPSIQVMVAGDSSALAAGDVNGDGLPDLILESYGGHTIQVSLNQSQ